MSIMWLLLPRESNPPVRQHSIPRAEQPLLHPQHHQAVLTVVFTPVSVCTLLFLPLACLFWLARKKICWHRSDPFSGLITLVVRWEGQGIGPVTPGWKGPGDNVPHNTCTHPQSKTSYEVSPGFSQSRPAVTSVLKDGVSQNLCVFLLNTSLLTLWKNKLPTAT